jgi:hypothetical protein
MARGRGSSSFGIDMRGWNTVPQEIGQADASALEAELRTRSELGKKLVGPARLEIEFHLNDIASPSEALRSVTDFLKPFEFLVSLVFAKFLELLLGHRFLRMRLQLGQPRVELAANDLSLFMVGTMKAE